MPAHYATEWLGSPLLMELVYRHLCVNLSWPGGRVGMSICADHPRTQTANSAANSLKDLIAGRLLRQKSFSSATTRKSDRSYASLADATQARIASLRSYPGKQKLSWHAASLLAARGTEPVIAGATSPSSTSVRFRHDPRLREASPTHFSEEQVRGPGSCCIFEKRRRHTSPKSRCVVRGAVAYSEELMREHGGTRAMPTACVTQASSYAGARCHVICFVSCARHHWLRRVAVAWRCGEVSVSTRVTVDARTKDSPRYHRPCLRASCSSACRRFATWSCIT